MYDELIIALQVCVDEKKGCVECPYQAKCLNTAGKYAAIADAADALDKLNKRIDFLMNCIYEAEDALNRGTDNEWARAALEKAMTVSPALWRLSIRSQQRRNEL